MTKRVLTWVYSVFFLLLFLTTGASLVTASNQIPSMGMHILQPEEVIGIREMFDVGGERNINEQMWIYVTIPYTLADVDRHDRWQEFFTTASRDKIIPIIRLTTEFKDGSWQVPSRYDVVKQVEALSQFDWPVSTRYVIAFNEVNHASEWGGVIDPQGYAEVLRFILDWTSTEQANFVVLPAALDLDAPQVSDKSTWDAFVYWRRVHQANPTVLSDLQVWNSHSYPNPAFSAPPSAVGRNSLFGFRHELNLVKELTGNDLPVIISETGWRATRATERFLPQYYSYAMENIWSQPEVLSVTPFIWRGAPGPFAEFSFLTEEGKPTSHYSAFQAGYLKIVSGL